MKRVLAILLVLLSLVSLCSCAHKPVLTSDEAFALGKKAVKIADQYLSYKATRDETKDALDDVYSRLHSLPNEEDGDSIISLYVSLIKLAVVGSTLDDHSDADVLDQRNTLAEYLGMRTRN